MARRWTEVRGRRLHARVVETAGPTAPTVVLVHGAGVSSRYMVPTARRLAPFCRAYALDLPGFGRSFKPSRTLTLPELADWLLAWIEAVGLDQVALVGNSFGCQVIVDLAARHPERIGRIVLQGPTVDSRARTWRQQIGRWLANSPGEARSEGLVIPALWRASRSEKVGQERKPRYRDATWHGESHDTAYPD